jgi:uncharacterized damage-inducible protein DinB
MHKISLFLACVAAAALPVHVLAQDVCKDAIQKQLKNSRDFTLKVAEAMPDADYGYKLTPAQMSFAEQIVHLSQGLTYFLSAFKGEKPNPPKPASKNKSDVIAFARTAFDQAISAVSALTPPQISKEYSGGGSSMTGAQMLIAMLEHNAHHRASAEMYLRAKGIKPPDYMD